MKKKARPSRPSTSRSRKSSSRKSTAASRTYRSKPKSRHTVRKKKQPESTIVGRFFTWLVILCVLILLGIAMVIWVVAPSFLIDFTTPQTILVVPEEINSQQQTAMIFHWSPDDNKQPIALLDAQMKMNVLGGYGEYELRAVQRLLTIDDRSPQFLRAAVSHGLRLPISQVYTTAALNDSLSESANSAALLSRLRKQILTNIIKQPYDFSRNLDQLRLYYLLAEIGEPQVIASLEELEQFAADVPVFLPEIAHDCPIAVINTTEQLGLATIVSGLIEAGGGFVVRVATQQDAVANSAILFEESCESVAKAATLVFPFDLPIETKTPDNQELSRHRAKVVILVGQDLQELF